MVKGKALAWVLVLMLGMVGTPLFAEEEGDEAAMATESAPPEPLKFVSQHRLRAGGVGLAYSVTAEEIYIRDDEGKQTASFFTISYTKAGVYFATEYMLHDSGIDADRITIKNYPGGHRMYLYQPSLVALSDDIVAFVEGH